MTKKPVTQVLQPTEQRPARLLIGNVSVEFRGNRRVLMTGGSDLEASHIRGHTQEFVPQGNQAFENQRYMYVIRSRLVLRVNGNNEPAVIF